MNLEFLLFGKGSLTVSGADGSAFIYTDELVHEPGGVTHPPKDPLGLV